MPVARGAVENIIAALCSDRGGLFWCSLVSVLSLIQQVPLFLSVWCNGRKLVVWRRWNVVREAEREKKKITWRVQCDRGTSQADITHYSDVVLFGSIRTVRIRSPAVKITFQIVCIQFEDGRCRSMVVSSQLLSQFAKRNLTCPNFIGRPIFPSFGVCKFLHNENISKTFSGGRQRSGVAHFRTVDR